MIAQRPRLPIPSFVSEPVPGGNFNGLTSEVAGLIRSQKRSYGSNVLFLSHPLERGRADVFPLNILYRKSKLGGAIADDRINARTSDRTGCYRIHGDVVRPRFLGERSS